MKYTPIVTKFNIRTRTAIAMFSAITILVATNVQTTVAAQETRRPNVVIILADDMGYSDLGSFGSEIATPNIDALANSGVRFTQFYTHASCSPTRSMLLSGVDTHLNGLGNMSEWTAPNQKGVSGYEGLLNDRVVTLPELLQGAGYHTYMVGKWHMGKTPDKIPRARGFERDFSLLDGAGSYWDMTNFTARTPNSLFTEDGEYLKELPKDYYATKTYTDKMIEFIDSNKGDEKPFFAYVAHQAPHDPYHLPRDWRNRHVGEYDIGWDQLRKNRAERQVELGILDEAVVPAERMWFVPPHHLLAPAARAMQGKKMELYAGMMENFDHHVGRLIDHLKEIGEYENTIFIVFGDNGAEGNDLFEGIAGTPGTLNYLFAGMNWSQTHPNAWGDPGSFVGYGAPWAQVSMTPFSQYKGMVAEGGIRNALIVSGPVSKRPEGSINRSIMHVADIMPTLLEVAGTTYLSNVDGKTPPPLYGISWMPLLTGKTDSIRSDTDTLAWEIFGNHAVRQGDWKLRWQWKPFGAGEWELYNLAQDPAERTDIASANPAKVDAMLTLWDEYAAANNVILPSRSTFEASDRNMPPRFPVDPGYPPLLTNRQYVPPTEMMKETIK